MGLLRNETRKFRTREPTMTFAFRPVQPGTSLEYLASFSPTQCGPWRIGKSARASPWAQAAHWLLIVQAQAPTELPPAGPDLVLSNTGERPLLTSPWARARSAIT